MSNSFDELSGQTDGLKTQMQDLDRLADSVGTRLVTAFAGAAIQGRNFSDVLKGLALSLSRMALSQALRPLGGMLSGLTGDLLANANGNAFGQGRVIPFADGGIVNSPTLFGMRGGMGLMGEAGPEAVIPLARGPDGKLGVRGGGGTHVTVNIATQDAQGFQRSQSQVAALIARAVARGRGTFDMSFDDVRFPTTISRGASGGPERRTEIVVTGSGAEERNSRWADSRRRYNAGFGVKSLDDIHEVIGFFEERRGQLHGFRWKDHLDFKSTAPLSDVTALDQAIGTGDGVTKTFQLVKRYGSGLRDYSRVIAKPVAGTVQIAVAGRAVTGFSVDALSGLVTLAAAPAAGAAVTAGFEFDVPVRFDTDELRINLTQFAAGEIPDIPIVEIRP